MKTCKRCKKPVEVFPVNKHGKPSTMCDYCYEDTRKRNAKKFELTKALQSAPPEGMGVCMTCKKPKPLIEFEPNPGRRRSIANDKLASTCQTCRGYRTGQVKSARQSLLPERKAVILKGRREYMRSWRDKIVAAYGGCCVCCGETTFQFLQLDHVNDDGGKHRKEIGQNSESLYRWAEKNGFPPILQVLCANCHNAKSFYGGCPHKASATPYLVERPA